MFGDLLVSSTFDGSLEHAPTYYTLSRSDKLSNFGRSLCCEYYKQVPAFLFSCPTCLQSMLGVMVLVASLGLNLDREDRQRELMSKSDPKPVSSTGGSSYEKICRKRNYTFLCRCEASGVACRSRFSTPRVVEL
jgi:hypothetical protein